MARKTMQERKAELENKRQQITAQLARIEAREKQKERKKDTRQKIIVGGAVLAHARLDAAFADQLAAILGKAVTRDIDKDTIADLFSKPDTGKIQPDSQKINVGTA